MSFQDILYIWLAVLFVAYASGWVAHIMGRGTRHLSGASYHAHGSRRRANPVYALAFGLRPPPAFHHRHRLSAPAPPRREYIFRGQARRTRRGQPPVIVLASPGIPRARSRSATSGLGDFGSSADRTIPLVEAPASRRAQTVPGQSGRRASLRNFAGFRQ